MLCLRCLSSCIANAYCATTASQSSVYYPHRLRASCLNITELGSSQRESLTSWWGSSLTQILEDDRLIDTLQPEKIADIILSASETHAKDQNLDEDAIHIAWADQIERVGKSVGQQVPSRSQSPTRMTMRDLAIKKIKDTKYIGTEFNGDPISVPTLIKFIISEHTRKDE